MQKIYHIYLRITALLPATIIFIMAKKDSISYIPDNLFYTLLIALGVGLISLIATRFSFYLAHKLPKTPFPKNFIVDIKPANDAFLPSYLGYFFVALSAPTTVGLLTAFFVILIFLILSKGAYFNPIYFIFGYNFYYTKDEKNVRNLIISKTIFKVPQDVEITELGRINDFTFIDLTK